MYTSDQLKALKDAYAKGVLSVELNGEKITFTSGKEMRRRIRELEGEILGSSNEMSVSYPSTGRGL